MESFGPEFIRNNFFDEGAEYNEDLRGRLASAPVFEAATNYQREFQDMHITKDEFVSTWNTIHRQAIEPLDAAAIKQGIMYENVTLRGEGIRVPKFDIDFAANVAMMSLIDKEKQQEISFQSYFEEDIFKGKFSGFTVRFNEAEENGTFAPVIAYRASIQYAHTPYAQIAMFATGDVGMTQLHFTKDEQLEGATAPLSTLFELCDERADSINLINIALAGVKKHDASVMRHVGYHAEKIIKGIDDSKGLVVETALIDLITNYLDKESSYELRSKKFSVLDSDDLTVTHYESEEDGLSIKNKYMDVVFRDQPIFANGQESSRKRRMLQLAFKANENIAFIPLTELDLFEKL